MLSLQNSRKKSLCYKRYTFFPIHDFNPSLVEPKTLFSNVYIVFFYGK